MAEGRERAVNEDARLRKDILEPTEATPEIQAKIDKVREFLEDESGTEFLNYKAVSYGRKGKLYVVRIDGGFGEGHYVDVLLDGDMFMNFDVDKDKDDELDFDM